MKPVHKGPAPKTYTQHGDAKIDLIERLGPSCSYCESRERAQSLDVEHIYPRKSHPKGRLLWSNFILACKGCNSTKNTEQKNKRQNNLMGGYLWPHLDNTFKAYNYHSDGRVEIEQGLSWGLKLKAGRTMKLVGLNSIQIIAQDYRTRGEAYDGIKLRAEHWEDVEDFREEYLENPSPKKAVSIARRGKKIGYFSIWMRVFEDRPEVRRELIKAFKADPACFDPVTTKPRKKGRL